MRNWTSKEDELLQSMAASGRSAKEIASELGRSIAAVHSRTVRFGISLKQVEIRLRRG
jgi:DNA-directed RNA polymerase specialized sigma24 family protein